jgi:hypothetical protein
MRHAETLWADKHLAVHHEDGAIALTVPEMREYEVIALSWTLHRT